MQKTEYIRNMQDGLKSEEAQYELKLSNFKKAAGTNEYKTTLQDIPFIREPEAVRKAMELLKNKEEDKTVRLMVLQKALSSIGDKEEYINDCLSILADVTEQAELRKAVLSVLKALSFSSKWLASLRPEYKTVLRSLLDDPDPGLREMAAEELAQHKDEYVQRRLLSGLTRPGEAVVTQAKAIQLLGYDIHAEHYPVVRNILQDPASDEIAKVEAIHVLAGDPGSKELLVDLMMDKKQPLEMRMSSATAIQASHPEDFLTIARPVILDENEEKEMSIVCLNALMHHHDANALYNDADFLQRLHRLRSLTASAELKKLSTQYLDNAARHIKKQ